MDVTPQAVKLGGLFKSRFFVSVIGFLAIIVSITWWIPKNFLPLAVPPTIIAAKPYAFRAEKYLYSNYDPEIILMGSSLVLRPTFECDKRYEKLVVPKNEEEERAFKHSYTKAEHLRRLLASRIYGSFNIINIGIPNCMGSDYYLILQKLRDFRKHPRLIVLAVAPRDFLDNKFPDPISAPGAQLLSACSPTRKWMRHPKAVADFIEHFFPPCASAENLLDTVTVRAVSCRYDLESNPDGSGHRLVDQCRRLLIQPIPPVIASATKNTLPPARNFIDLAPYNWCYNPPDFERLKQQFLCLEKFVNLASQGNTNVVLVDMPLTVENQALIQQEALKTYKASLRQLAIKYRNVMLVDASRLSGCTDDDFFDSAHLNASGGHKCFECIAKEISQNSSLRAKLCTLQSAPQL
jgi:hypothetical protein